MKVSWIETKIVEEKIEREKEIESCWECPYRRFSLGEMDLYSDRYDFYCACEDASPDVRNMVYKSVWGSDRNLILEKARMLNWEIPEKCPFRKRK